MDFFIWLNISIRSYIFCKCLAHHFWPKGFNLAKLMSLLAKWFQFSQTNEKIRLTLCLVSWGRSGSCFLWACVFGKVEMGEGKGNQRRLLLAAGRGTVVPWQRILAKTRIFVPLAIGDEPSPAKKVDVDQLNLYFLPKKKCQFANSLFFAKWIFSF